MLAHALSLFDHAFILPIHHVCSVALAVVMGDVQLNELDTVQRDLTRSIAYAVGVCLCLIGCMMLCDRRSIDAVMRRAQPAAPILPSSQQQEQPQEKEQQKQTGSQLRGSEVRAMEGLDVAAKRQQAILGSNSSAAAGTVAVDKRFFRGEEEKRSPPQPLSSREHGDRDTPGSSQHGTAVADSPSPPSSRNTTFASLVLPRAWSTTSRGTAATAAAPAASSRTTARPTESTSSRTSTLHTPPEHEDVQVEVGGDRANSDSRERNHAIVTPSLYLRQDWPGAFRSIRSL